MLKLSGLSEAYLDPEQQRIWDSELATIQSAIQGEVTHLFSAIEAINGWKPEWKQHETSIEDYPLDLIKHLAILKKEAIDYRMNINAKQKDERMNYLNNAFNTLKKILIVFHDLITKKEQVIQANNPAKEIKDFYLLHMEPLVIYMQQELDNSSSIGGVLNKSLFGAQIR